MLPDLSETVLETVLPAQRGDVLELDELWSFVLCKRSQMWLWLALCRRTRQVVAYALGDRSAATCQLLWSRIPKEYRYKRTYTDFCVHILVNWEAYFAVVPERHHFPVYKDEGETNRVERFNNTLRQRLARFVRKTLSFSKCPFMHECCVSLFLHHYNLLCIKKLKLQA